MLLAAAVVVAAVGLGIALALLPIRGQRGLGLLKTFALTTSVSVVAFHLLPEAMHELGWWALGGAVITLALPRLVEHFLGGSHGGTPLALELGYAGLVVHSISDGLAIGRFGTGEVESLGAQLDVMLAVSAHTVPVIAVLVLAYARNGSARAGVLRAVGLGAATLVGVVLGSRSELVLGPLLDAVIATAVSGLLLHIVAHGLEEDAPDSAPARWLDLTVAAAGLGLGLWLERGASHDGENVGQILQDRALELLLGYAPLFLLALLAATVARLVTRRLFPSDGGDAIPHQGGADVVVLSLGLLGWRLTVLRLLPMLSHWLGGAPREVHADHPGPTRRAPAWLAVAVEHGAALIGGVLLAAIAFAAPDRAAANPAMNLGAALAVGVISHYSPLAATPLAASLLALDVPPHWIVAGFCLGAVTVAVSRRRWLLILAVELLAGVALVLATALLATTLSTPSLRPLPPGVSLTAAGLLAAWLLCGVWRAGVRRWIWSAALGSGYAATHGNGVQQDPARRDPMSQSLRG